MKKILLGLVSLCLVLFVGAGTVLGADTITIDVSPDVLGASSTGVYVTVHADIAYDAVNIDSLTLNGELQAVKTEEDLNGNLVAKFDLADVLALALDGDSISDSGDQGSQKGSASSSPLDLTFSGTTTEGSEFYGTDTIRIFQ